MIYSIKPLVTLFKTKVWHIMEELDRHELDIQNTATHFLYVTNPD